MFSPHRFSVLISSLAWCLDCKPLAANRQSEVIQGREGKNAYLPLLKNKKGDISSMGIFFTAKKPVAPAVKDALKSALIQDPKSLANSPDAEAAERAHELVKTTTPEFNLRNFVLAVIIAGVLLGLAIWLDNDAHKDISKALMTSFQSFSGIVVGLLGGEAQKSAS
jgi:hypothetical protein